MLILRRESKKYLQNQISPTAPETDKHDAVMPVAMGTNS